MSKTILITGTTNGIGRATAIELHRRGHRLILVNRNNRKALELKESLEKNNPFGCPVTLYQADFSNLDSVETCTRKIYKNEPSLDIMFNNAGLFMDNPAETAQGVEMTMGVNYLSQVLFTELLLPLVRKSPSGAILNTSSRAALFGKIYYRYSFSERHPHGFKGYSASKLAQILYLRSLSERIDIPVVAIHPGEAATGIWTGDSFTMKLAAPMARRRYSSPEDAAATGVVLVESNDLAAYDGLMVEKEDQVVKYKKNCLDAAASKKLKKMTAEFLAPYL